MIKQFIFGFATVAVSLASAASYNVTIYQNANVAGQALKPGDYKVQIKDNSASFKHNKQLIEVPARTETAPTKFNTTMVRYGKDGDVQEILVGGTTTKIVFGAPSGASAAGVQ